jgi:D-lactate dehydrogenase
VLGSFFLNPTVGAGVALGSGGTQLRKGPVYTERVLYARVDADGKVRVVDSLGLALPPGTSSALQLLSRKDTESVSLALDPATVGRKSHDAEYASQLCVLDDHVARYNADTHGPEAVRSEGKVRPCF